MKFSHSQLQAVVCIAFIGFVLVGCGNRQTLTLSPTAPSTILMADGAPLLFSAPVNLEAGEVTFLLTGAGLRLTVLDSAMRTFTLQPDDQASSVGNPLLIVQTPLQTEAVMTVNGMVVTLRGTTAFAITPPSALDLIVWEGVSIVAVSGKAQVIHAGTMVSIRLDAENNFQAHSLPEAPQTATLLVSEAHNLLLPRNLVLPTVEPTAAVNVNVTGTCTPEPRWTGSYVVQRGDSLSQIANRFGLTLTELQTGNCLLNPNRLDIGQVLFVPFSLTPATPRPTATPPDPETIALRADPERIESGECSAITWQANDAQSVLFDDQSAPSAGVQTVCPTTTTIYNLLVIDAAGRQAVYTITVTVLDE
jgi:LysM repeat protein